jgi:hypothetical protein
VAVARARLARVRELFPEVLLAVLGIIQALALELVWEEGVGGLDRWRALGAGLAGSLQISAILLGVIVVWLMYATMVMRFVWTPRFRDLVMPFVFGIAEFLVIEWMAPERLAAWFLGMAAIFAFAMAMTFETFRSVIFREETEIPTMRQQASSYVPGGVALVGLLACAAVAHRFGPASPASAAALALANLGLLGQIAVFRTFWRRDLADAR